MNWFAIRVEPGRERRVSYRLKLRAVALGAMRIYLPICEEAAYLDLHRTELGEDGKIRVVPTGETQHVRGTIVPGYIFVQTEMNDDVAADIAQIKAAGVDRCLDHLWHAPRVRQTDPPDGRNTRPRLDGGQGVQGGAGAHGRPDWHLFLVQPARRAAAHTRGLQGKIPISRALASTPKP